MLISHNCFRKCGQLEIEVHINGSSLVGRKNEFGENKIGRVSRPSSLGKMSRPSSVGREAPKAIRNNIKSRFVDYYSLPYTGE